jgi:hypothetical protein
VDGDDLKTESGKIKKKNELGLLVSRLTVRLYQDNSQLNKLKAICRTVALLLQSVL